MFAAGGPGIADSPEASVGFGARTWHFPAGGTLATPAYSLRLLISCKALYSLVFSSAFTFSSQ